MRYALVKLMLKVARVTTIMFVIGALSLSISATAESRSGIKAESQCDSIGDEIGSGITEPETTFII